MIISEFGIYPYLFILKYQNKQTKSFIVGKKNSKLWVKAFPPIVSQCFGPQ
jgi:hypothetical protein